MPAPASHRVPGAADSTMSDSGAWRRNVLAVASAAFLGFTGFTLVMPFLPLFLAELGVHDVGQVAVWAGLSLGVTPAITAIMAPLWGRLADRFGRKLMIVRSLFSFVLVMLAMVYATRPWHVLALRTVQGLFSGYGALAVTMAADSAPKDKLALAIGWVQTAQRLGPALGPVIGGALAEVVGLRRAFLVAAAFYLVGMVIVWWLYDESRAQVPTRTDRENSSPQWRPIIQAPGTLVLLCVIFVIQFIDRSFGPILPLYVAENRWAVDRVALLAGSLFSASALTGALGNLAAGPLLRRYGAREVMASATMVGAIGVGVFAARTSLAWAFPAAACLGLGAGLAMTTAFTTAGSSFSADSRATGFGLLTSASLAGMALSPVVSGLVGAASIRAVFVLDTVALASLAVIIWGCFHPRSPAPQGDLGV